MSKAALLVLALGIFQTPSEIYMPGLSYDLPAVKISAEAIQAAIKDRDMVGYNGRGIRMVDAGGGEGGHRVGLSIAVRFKGFSDAAAVHDRVSEVYYLLEGEGVMETGGTVRDAQRRPDSGGNGTGLSGSGIDGAERIHLGQGDMLVIPAGTPHRWAFTSERTVYTIVRVDPENVTTLE
jgi:mannose-6-phosphate isomerase-like protein (cupin superfamily)